jgi:RHH-type proline utilization regulon transcriptional repressor/proline dehydrogenase/delta 1-pyrroline-5-carboxylate dehydrogenase
VIDEAARAGIEAHLAAMRARGRHVVQPVPADAALQARGSFVAPALVRIDAIADLQREVFGPVLHLLRYEREALPRLLDEVHATGYGLTCGLHTRIDETVARVAGASLAGNLYVNRNMVGAVVGVQPFGGEGLSGTGPKAGGPLYLLRLLATRPADAARRAVLASGGDAAAPVRGMKLARGGAATVDPALAALRTWAHGQAMPTLAARCDALAADQPAGPWRNLAGPTGEANLYGVRPRDAVLCLAHADEDLLAQLAAVLAVGSRAVWPAAARALHARLPADAAERIALAQDWQQPTVAYDAVLCAGDDARVAQVAQALAARPGPVIGLARFGAQDDGAPLERLVVERSISINTAAAGGNASLMTLT